MIERISNIDILDGDNWGIEYFSPKEFDCTHCGNNETAMELVYRLDELRSYYGHPLKITSGYRCPHHPLSINKPVGSMSSHIKGLAADIAISGSRQRFMVLALIHEYDIFQRVGIAKDFIHVDIDQDKEQLLTWLY